jgi:hypothetical protein
MPRTAIRCRCGQRIGQRDVMHAGYYPRVFGPSVVLVRYRCGRCRKRGERFVKQEEWESGIFLDSPTETSIDEQLRLDALGPIALTELVRFHEELESIDLSALNREFGGQ